MLTNPFVCNIILSVFYCLFFLPINIQLTLFQMVWAGPR